MLAFFCLISLAFLSEAAVDFTCKNVSEAMLAFSSDPFDPENPYIVLYSSLPHLEVRYPMTPCFDEILPSLYNASKMASVSVRKYRSNLDQCCLNANNLASQVQDLSSKVFYLSSNVSSLRSLSTAETRHVDLRIESLSRNITTFAANQLHLITRIKSLEDSRLYFANISKALIANGMDHENRLEILEVNFNKIDKAITNSTYHLTSNEDPAQKENIYGENTGLFSDSEDYLGEKEESKEETKCNFSLVYFFMSNNFVKLLKSKDADCEIVEELIYSITASVLTVMLVVYLCYLIICYLFCKLVYGPFKKKFYIDSQLHSIMKKVRKNSRFSSLETRVGRLHLYELKNVQYSVDFSHLINKVAEGEDVYYVAAVMSVELRARPNLTFFERVFRSVRYREDTMLYFVVFGYFSNFRDTRSSPPPVSKVTMTHLLGEIPSFVLAGGWIIPQYGRVQNFLQDMAHYLKQITIEGSFGDRALLNIKGGSVPHSFLQAFSNNDQLEFQCEGIVMFKNSLLSHVILLAEDGEATALPELQNLDITTLPPGGRRKRKGMQLTAMSAPSAEDVV